MPGPRTPPRAPIQVPLTTTPTGSADVPSAGHVDFKVVGGTAYILFWRGEVTETPSETNGWPILNGETETWECKADEQYRIVAESTATLYISPSEEG